MIAKFIGRGLFILGNVYAIRTGTFSADVLLFDALLVPYLYGDL